MHTSKIGNLPQAAIGYASDMEKLVRRPHGLPSWAFWVIALFVGGAIGNIPYAGKPLMVVVLIAAFVYWQKFPKVPAFTLLAYPFVGSQEVVGESHYHAKIGAFVGRYGSDAHAVLIHEPRNKHSPSRSAVRVDLAVGSQTFTCGYIPEHAAPEWANVVKNARRDKVRLYCDARIFGGRDDAPNYGVWLYPASNPDPPKKSDGPRFVPDDSAN